MDDNKYLNDDNLEQLGFINRIDTYNIVNKQFNKKNEKYKIIALIMSLALILMSSIYIIIFAKSIDIKSIFSLNKVLKYIGLYYFLCTSALLLLTIPILKRRRVF